MQQARIAGFFLLLTLLCYWPFSLGLFSAKNDNIIAILPLRYNVSEALRNGQLPLWSPYIYLGFPMHGDMQSGAWNPLVWLLSMVGRYDVTLLHLEILIYIFLAGLGMYRLLMKIKCRHTPAMVGASAYLLCGFITDVGGSNLPFLASACWLPWLFSSFYECLRTASKRSAILSGVWLWLLLVCGYPAFLIIAIYILLTGLVLAVAIRWKLNENRMPYIKKITVSSLLMLLCFALLSAPALVSFISILPHYSRGAGLSLSKSLEDSYQPIFSISILFPSAAIKNNFYQATDLISRNLYFNGILLAFGVVGMIYKPSRLKLILFAGATIALALALGNELPLRSLTFRFLPLMNSFRHPANFRLFVILAAIPLACIAASELNHHPPAGKKIWKACIIGLSIICMGTMVYALWKGSGSHLVSMLTVMKGSREGFKAMMANLNFDDHLLIDAALQLAFLLPLLFTFSKPKTKLIYGLIILNSMAFAQLNMVYTFASQVRPQLLNSQLASFPPGFPLPGLSHSLQSAFTPQTGPPSIGLLNFYNKQISMEATEVSPTYMTRLHLLYDRPDIQKLSFLFPVAYLSDTVRTERQVLPYRGTIFSPLPQVKETTVIAGSTSTERESGQLSIKATAVSGNSFAFEVNSDRNCFLTLQQVYLPGWKVRVDGNEANLVCANIAFMGTRLRPGLHRVEFEYSPPYVRVALIVSILAALIIFGFLLFGKFRLR